MRAVLASDGVVTAHNLRARTSGGRTWVDVHVTVDPEMNLRDAHDVATGGEGSLRQEVGSDTQVIVHVEPAEPPHTRPDAIVGERVYEDRLI